MRDLASPILVGHIFKSCQCCSCWPMQMSGHKHRTWKISITEIHATRMLQMQIKEMKFRAWIAKGGSTWQKRMGGTALRHERTLNAVSDTLEQCPSWLCSTAIHTQDLWLGWAVKSNVIFTEYCKHFQAFMFFLQSTTFIATKHFCHPCGKTSHIVTKTQFSGEREEPQFAHTGYVSFL